MPRKAHTLILDFLDADSAQPPGVAHALPGRPAAEVVAADVAAMGVRVG